MPAYEIIARRFRPQIFAEVVGQETVVTTLKNAMRLNKLGSAYLFCGPRGTGKTTLARLFAKALNCQQLTSSLEPCNSCSSCLEITSGHSLNLLEIDGASNRGIDDIRQINETVGYAPSSGKYKIYLIDEVHMLTKEAFNALLKTLEEPPSHVKFFFATTEAHKVLPTIMSRCQRFDLRSISTLLIKDKLKLIVAKLEAHVEEEALSLIADHSEGALRDAESLLDQILCYSEGVTTAAHVTNALGLVPKLLFFQLDKAIHNHDLLFAFELSENIDKAGYELNLFIEALTEHISSILQIILGKSPIDTNYQLAATLYTSEQCLYILDYLIHWRQEMARTPFKRVGIEIILLHLLRSRYRISSDILVQRLIELENQLPKIESAPLIPTVKEALQVPLISTPPSVRSQKQETLLRFAAIELEATLKKE